MGADMGIETMCPLLLPGIGMYITIGCCMAWPATEPTCWPGIPCICMGAYVTYPGGAAPGTCNSFVYGYSGTGGSGIMTKQECAIAVRTAPFQDREQLLPASQSPHRGFQQLHSLHFSQLPRPAAVVSCMGKPQNQTLRKS